MLSSPFGVSIEMKTAFKDEAVDLLLGNLHLILVIITHTEIITDILVCICRYMNRTVSSI